jgi:hypothetical protein
VPRPNAVASCSTNCRKLLDQLEMQLEDLETAAAEAEAAIEPASDETTTVRPFTRAKPVRGPLPDHLPRERVVVTAPTSCPCCGGKLAKLGETITETLESIPRSYKVIQNWPISTARGDSHQAAWPSQSAGVARSISIPSRARITDCRYSGSPSQNLLTATLAIRPVPATLDRQFRCRRLEHRFTGAAGIARADVADHLQPGRDFLQHLGDVFTKAGEFGTIVPVASADDRRLMHHGLARQMRWQRLALRGLARLT